MADIKVLGGDFSTVVGGAYFAGRVALASPKAWSADLAYDVATQMITLAADSSRQAFSAGGTVGGVALGGLVLGPLGAVGGALLAGKKQLVLFEARFADGRYVLGEIKAHGWAKMWADYQAGRAAVQAAQGRARLGEPPA